MVKVHHISMICGSEAAVDFYRQLGFAEKQRISRARDTVILMESDAAALEIFLDPTHPPHPENLEHRGLRYIALQIPGLEETARKMNADIRTDWSGNRFILVRDPDGQPIQLYE